MELTIMTTSVAAEGKIQDVREYFDQQELMSQMNPKE